MQKTDIRVNLTFPSVDPLRLTVCGELERKVYGTFSLRY